MEMLGRIVKKLVELPAEKLGLLYDLLEKLTSSSSQQWWHELAKFLRRENPFVIKDVSDEWNDFYRKYFRFSLDFSGVYIPVNSGGFDRVIFIPKGLKLSHVLKAIREQFPAWSYTDGLDKDIIENVRRSDHNYAIRLRERVEADEELKSVSANRLKKENVNCVTLLERLVLELKYFSETGQHLDAQNWTLCSGSRNRAGCVPCVRWNAGGGELRVSWYDTDNALGHIRARQAVS